MFPKRNKKNYQKYIPLSEQKMIDFELLSTKGEQYRFDAFFNE